jgi:hypothetical protein
VVVQSPANAGLLAPTGKLSRIGGFRADTQVMDLAIPLDQG